MATTITPTDVITEYGSYYINQGQNMNSLLMRPFFPFGTREAFTNVPTEDTQLRYSDTTVGEILQRYQDTFTAKGSVIFKPVTINLEHLKIDQQFNPTNLVNSWLGFLTNLKENDRVLWPFTRWFIDVYIMNQVMEDLETKAVYTGVKAAITPGTATNAVDVIDGVRKKINDYITATTITPIATGAPSANPIDWVTQVETFVKGVPKKFWRMKMTLNMNEDLAVLFNEGMQQKYNLQYSQVADTMAIRNFSNISVKGRQSMDGSTKIWMTPIENAVFAVKGFENAQGFQLEKVDRNVKVWSDFMIGLDFLLKDIVFTNDQDLV